MVVRTLISCHNTESTRLTLQAVVAVIGTKRTAINGHAPDIDLGRIVGYHSDQDSAGKSCAAPTEYAGKPLCCAVACEPYVMPARMSIAQQMQKHL